MEGIPSIDRVWMWWTLIKVSVTTRHPPKRLWVRYKLKIDDPHPYLHGSLYP